MNIFKIALFISVSIFISSCASMSQLNKTFQNWQSKLSERKTFQIRNVWVKQTPAQTNMRFRKINRMSPLFFIDKQKREFLIQGNAIDGIAAYLRTSGEEVWRLRIENGVESPAALVKERLFFGGNDGNFYSVEASTGKVLWKHPTRSENLSEPLIDEGIVYFLSGANTLYALDAASGKQLWLYTRQDLNAFSVRGGSRPAIKNGILYAGFSDGYFLAIHAKTGQLKWEKLLNKNKKFRDLDTNPLIEQEFIYLLGFDDKVYCLRLSNGDIVWQVDGGGYGGFLIIGDKLYFPSTNDELVAVDKASGKKLWAHKTTEGIATTPTHFRGMLIFGESHGALKFLDSNSGRMIGAYDPGKGVFSQPAVDEKKNMVYFVSGEANLYALEFGFKFPPTFNYLK